jgi:hypothetical protein
MTLPWSVSLGEENASQDKAEELVRRNRRR